MELKTLFSPERIGNVQIKNRIVRSATHMECSEKYGYVSKKLINIYEELASGGTGLIISGFTAVDPGGSASPYQDCLFDDSFIPGQKKLVDAVHEYSEVKIAIQLAHTGRQGNHPKYPVVAPSPIPFKITGSTPHELTVDEISKLSQKFIDAGRRVFECGYDMIQLHAAHGYFLCNFISPYTNKRKDEYGGSTQKRAKILIDIYNGLRDELGKKFPIMIKLQVEDFIPNGLELDEGLKYVKILSEVGFDAIEPSGGGSEAQILTNKSYPSLRIKSSEEENYFLPHAKEIKKYMEDSKLIVMGGIRNPIFAEKILQEKTADFISLSRPLIYEPDLPNRWYRGDLSPAKCISCNGCFMSMRMGPVYCVTRKRLEEKKKK
ncbi:MAG: NADH:flavin oxidoreductase [Promethearchaeota archaeon]